MHCNQRINTRLYNNNSNKQQSKISPNDNPILDQPNTGIPSITKARLKRKQQKQAQKQRFIDNNPMKKLSTQPLCPWKPLDARETIESYVTALSFSLLYTAWFMFPPFVAYCVFPTNSKETK